MKEAERFYSIALRHGCGYAAPELLQARAWAYDAATGGGEDGVRTLQSAQHLKCFTVDIALCRQYSNNVFGCETQAGAMAFVGHVMRQGSKPRGRSSRLRKVRSRSSPMGKRVDVMPGADKGWGCRSWIRMARCGLF